MSEKLEPMTPPANEALAVIAAEIISLPTMATMASVNGVRCDPTGAVNRLVEAHATLTRLLAAADTLAEAGNALSFAAQITGGTAGRDEHLVSAIERYAVALTAYQEARK